MSESVSDISEELMNAFITCLKKEEPIDLYADRAFATPNEAYSALVELIKRTFPEEKLRAFIKMRQKETLEEALSVAFVFSCAYAELRETFNLPPE